MEAAIKGVLPLGKDYKLAHFQTHPRETHPLITQSSSSKSDLKTLKIEHFISVIHREVLFYGLEIFIYITIDEDNDTTEKLLFVSKADTNGLNSTKVNIGLLTQTIIEYLIKIPIDHYLKNIIPKESTSIRYSKNSITKYTSTKESLNILLGRHQEILQKPEEIKPYSITSYPSNIIVKIALFTRAEPQYLFPESSKNPQKHVLGGEGLLKWWLKLLDQVIVDLFDESTVSKLQIPAEDPKVIQRYISNLKFPNWSVGDIFNGRDEDIAVYKIPVFPDDPKARFLEHLVVENRVLKISLKQFWEELQARQEFRLGVTVSVIGIEGRLKRWNTTKSDGVLLSRKHFKKLKNYITGEDYSTEDGAIEAVKNVLDYMETHFGIELKDVRGEYVKAVAPLNNGTVKRPVVNSLTTTLVRKKPKK